MPIPTFISISDNDDMDINLPLSPISGNEETRHQRTEARFQNSARKHRQRLGNNNRMMCKMPLVEDALERDGLAISNHKDAKEVDRALTRMLAMVSNKQTGKDAHHQSISSQDSLCFFD
ncbi:expressed unknown protein [Seminavis robusta]|uniref:Uncharacterized protein n=1 Tax=Seminavis robusta TaxID=568900 RepID=A0A9N8F1E0_9STRA|nr:expressed unknown protein [Seminavis robusta]|eukprot:Sro2507_g329730.1 n/a (119) ;mRNA; f:11714-12070